jgi:hypothetical protein
MVINMLLQSIIIGMYSDTWGQQKGDEVSLFENGRLLARWRHSTPEDIALV